MRLYRVTWAAPDRWRRLHQSDPGHPLYVPAALQGAGRFDNPDHYAALYTATEPAGAVAEVFGNRHTWTSAMFSRPKDELVRVLVTLETEPRLLDLDDTVTLQRLALRPSDVVRRNPERTREVALRLWREARRRVSGLRWWSYYRPEWDLVMLWSKGLDRAEWFGDVRVDAVETLHLEHPAIQQAAADLPRVLAD